MQKPRLLIIDDDVLFLRDVARDLGHDYLCATTDVPSEAIDKAMTDNPDAILLDIKFGENRYLGLDILTELRELRPFVPVVMITDLEEFDTAVQSIKKGAFHYVVKPEITVPKLTNIIDRAIETEKLRRQSMMWKRQQAQQTKEIQGNSEAIRHLLKQINAVAPLDATVLISGEKGVGKELVAKEIHRRSDRSGYEFEVVDCTYLTSPDLARTELFGHEKGAFTDGREAKPGAFEFVGRGTLFVDEIGNLQLEVQGMLLRVLESGEFRRLRGERTQRTQARVIAATNKDLGQLVKTGKFRDDLYDRLLKLPLRVPPLRERVEDIPLLLNQFLQEFCVQFKKPLLRIGDDVLPALQRREWPGNVRELQNSVLGAVLACSSDVLTYKDFEFFQVERPATRSDGPIAYHEARTKALHAFKKQYIEEMLGRASGSLPLAAKTAGIPKRSLARMIKEVGLPTSHGVI
jgi:two-component system nitrogen regulation response regulator NtrX